MAANAVRFSWPPDIELQDLPLPQSTVIDDGDIYRGEPAFPKDDTSSVTTSSGSSSSSSSGRIGGRLGVIAAVVELAVSRWARGVRKSSSVLSVSTTSSSTATTTTTSGTSANTTGRARRRLRRRRSASQTSLQTIQSERDIVARISRLKALEQSRQLARQFALYVPTTVAPQGQNFNVVPEANADDAHQRVHCTTSLSLILSQLEVVTKRSTSRRPRGKSRGPPHHIDPSQSSRRSFQLNPDNLEVMGPLRSPPSFDPSKKAKKGRSRESPAATSPKYTLPSSNHRLMPKAWFLDVTSPTWADLRALGKLLHLHPLTLEDILQKDPREKLEVFPKLGYYFVSFRAIESRAERAKILRELETNPNLDSENTDIPIGETNIYLAVFNEGICCFHYHDISEHIDRVRNRVALLDDVVNMSSDWIAHGILDSVVDAFFPVLNEIEKEVISIDRLVYIQEDQDNTPNNDKDRSSPPSSNMKLKDPKSLDNGIYVNEKRTPKDSIASEGSVRPHFAPPRPTPRLMFRHARRYISRVWYKFWTRKSETRISPRTLTLRRMAQTRKVVTSLGRLLATKADVISQIRKRLLQSGEPSLGNGGTKGEELEVAMYMGDVQDHILTLQHSLTHIERVLSQSHPSYLANLRTTMARSKGGTDKALLYLSALGIGILICQVIIGVCSLNVTVVGNVRAPGHPYYGFGIVVFLACLFIITLFAFVYRWRGPSKKPGV